MRPIAVLLAALFVAVPSFAYDSDGLQIVDPKGPDNLSLAEKHFDDAVRFFRAGKYELARVEFEASYAISKKADILHNLSFCAEKQGQIADAIRYEERFLAAQRADLTQGEIDQTEGRLARLRQRLAAPLAPSNRPAPADRRRPPVGAISLLASGGAALLLVGIGCGVGAYATARAFDQPVTVAEEATLRSRGQALDRAGIALDVIGGAALMAGAIWTIVERVRRPAFGPAPSASRMVLGLAW